MPTRAVPKSVSICRTHDRVHGYGVWRTYLLPTRAVFKSVSICRTHDRAHAYGGGRTYFPTRHGARVCRLYARFVSTFHTQLQIFECPSQSKFRVLSEQYRPGRAPGTKPLDPKHAGSFFALGYRRGDFLRLASGNLPNDPRCAPSFPQNDSKQRQTKCALRVFPTLTRSAGRFSTRTTRSKAVAGVNLRSDPDVWAGASGRTGASAG